jgi:replication factor C subunit 1
MERNGKAEYPLHIDIHEEDGKEELCRSHTADGKRKRDSASESKFLPPSKHHRLSSEAAPCDTRNTTSNLDAPGTLPENALGSCCAANTNAARDHSADPWTEKYAPTSEKDLVGQGHAIKRLAEFLDGWSKLLSNQKTPESSNAPKHAVLLAGPPGIGKSTSARLLAETRGFDVIEVNASDSRDKADKAGGINGKLANRVKELVSNTGLRRSATNSHKSLKQLLIMDEVDGMSSGDRGGLQDLVDTIKKTHIPIVCICNDRFNQKLRTLQNHTETINYSRPNKNSVKKRLKTIVQRESLTVDENEIAKLIEESNNDVRVALNQLQMIKLRSRLDKKAGLTFNSSKNIDMNVSTVAEKLFAANDSSNFNDRLQLAFQDMDLVPLYIQENYINYVPRGVKQPDSTEHWAAVSSCSRYISDADLMNAQIRRSQRWSLLPNAMALGVVAAAHSIRGRRVSLSKSDRGMNRFPAWLGKNATSNKCARLMADLQSHASAGGGTVANATAVRAYYIPVLVEQILAPMESEGKSGVPKAIELLDEYNLTREDFDAMLEVTKLTMEESRSKTAEERYNKLNKEVKKDFTARAGSAERALVHPGFEPVATQTKRGNNSKGGKGTGAGRESKKKGAKDNGDTAQVAAIAADDSDEEEKDEEEAEDSAPIDLNDIL